MHERTSLLPSSRDADDTHITVSRDDDDVFEKQRPQQQPQPISYRSAAGCLLVGLLLLWVAWIGHMNNNELFSAQKSNFINSGDKMAAAWQGQQDQEMLDFGLSLEQKLVLYDHWKDFISWRDLWNRTQEEWHHIKTSAQQQKKTNNSNNDVYLDPETIKNHTKMLVNVSQEKGQKWWHSAHDFFQNVTDQIMSSQDDQQDQGAPQSGEDSLLSSSSSERTERMYLHDNSQSDNNIPSSNNAQQTNVYLNHSRAYELLIGQGSNGAFHYSADYFLIQQGFDAQINQAYCGVATASTILNSLRGIIDLPMDPVYDPHPYVTQQSSIFNECTDATALQHNATFDGILSAPFGANLETVKALLECHLVPTSWSVTAYHVDPNHITMNQMREDLKTALKNPQARVMINYYRKTADQAGGGHFSPIGSYAPQIDAFLIMDVAKYKYPPVWIPTEKLYRSLATIDACGTWDGPAAQVQLPPELLHPASLPELATAMGRLNCRKAYRGYIVVEPK